MKIHELFEAPISDVSFVGNWEKNSSFGTQDRKLLSNPKAVQKIKAMWQYPEDVMFNVLCVNSPDARQWAEEGMVTREWLAHNMPRDWPTLEPMLKDREVNVLFTNNRGAQRVPLTGWVMAHRLGHAFEATVRRNRFDANLAYYFREALEDFNDAMNEIMDCYRIRQPADASYGRRSKTDILRLRQAMPLRGFQYFVSGKIEFNQPPQSFRYGRDFFGCTPDDAQYIERRLDALGFTLKDYFAAACSNAVGQILLM
jgi:hypothetical protein